MFFQSSPVDMVRDARLPVGLGGCWYGVYPALVSDIKDPDGQGRVKILDSNGNSVKLESAGITVTASAKVTINASTAQISAGMVSVDAGMSKFSGVVQCSTLITNSVVSASYTPGAGNIW